MTRIWTVTMWLRRARAHVLDPNLEKDLLPPARLFNFSYRDRAVAELGKK